MENKSDTISLLDLILIFAKRWKFIFFTSAGAAVFIVLYSIYTLMVPPTAPFNYLVNYYRPTVEVKFKENSGSSFNFSSDSTSELGLLSSLVGGSTGSSNTAFAIEILKGNTILDKIIEEFDLITYYGITENPRTASRNILIEKINAEFDAETGILRISYEDQNKELATNIINALLNALEERFNKLSLEENSLQLDFLEERLEFTLGELKTMQDKIIAFQQEYGIYDITIQTEAQVSDIIKLTSAIVEKQLELLQVQEYRTDNDPVIIGLKNEIANAEKILAMKKEGSEIFQNYLIPHDLLPEIAAQYESMRKEVEILAAVYLGVRQQYETTRLQSYNTSKLLQIIEEAEVPEIKAGPSRGKISIIFTFAIFFLSIFIVLIQEYFSNVKNDEEENQKLEEIKNEFRFWKK